MRLTLRTLLAYLDDVLEPGDAKELGDKIEESEFAGKLVQRIRNSVRKLRLNAPPVDGKGMGGDPNTVSEYLDNSLPPERVPEFEKVCLESDANLSEVASCHQILTLVLGEPADVSTETRNRMYQVGVFQTEMESHLAAESEGRQTTSGPDLVTPEERAKMQAAAAIPPSQSGNLTDRNGDGMVTRADMEVPGYLKDGDEAKSTWPRLVLTLAIAFLLVFGLLQVVKPFSPDGMLAGIFGKGADDSTTVADASNPGDDNTNVNPDSSDTPAVNENTGNGLAAAATGINVPGTSDLTGTNVNPPAGITDNGVSNNGVRELVPPNEVFSNVRPESNPTDVTNNNVVNPLPNDIAAAGQNVPPVTETGDPAGANTIDPGNGNSSTTGDPALPSQVASVDPALVDAEAGQPTATSEPPAVQNVGNYISDNQVLLRFDGESRSWQRLPARAQLTSVDELINLPPCRSQLMLKPGIHVFSLDSAAVRLLPNANDTTPSMLVRFGRIAIQTLSAGNPQLFVELGDRRGLLEFRDGNSQVALDVQSYLPPGADPLKVRASRVTQLYVPAGQVAWTEQPPEGSDQTAAPVILNAGEARIMIEGYDDASTGKIVMPEWISKSELGFLDQKAWIKLEPLLDSERPMGLSLLEQAVHKQTDVRSLAVRCLCYLDRFDPMFASDGALNDLSQRASWSNHLAAIRQAISRDPGAAEAALTAIQKNRGDDAALIWQMVIGFGPDQLAGGGAATLVENLNHPSLDVRVLAFENLQQITGKSLGYRPEHTDGFRKTFVRQWRQRLEAGEIAYAAAPSPVPNLNAATP